MGQQHRLCRNSSPLSELRVTRPESADQSRLPGTYSHDPPFTGVICANASKLLPAADPTYWSCLPLKLIPGILTRHPEPEEFGASKGDTIAEQ